MQTREKKFEGRKFRGGWSSSPPYPRWIEPGTVIQSSNTSKKIEINGTFNCKTRNVVYCITCEHCKLQYIGQTTRSLDERVREHIGYIRNLYTNQATGEHFNLSGHELYHLKVSVLEKVWNLGEVYFKYENLNTSEVLWLISREWTEKNTFYLIVNCN